MSSDPSVTWKDVEEAYARIKDHLHKTPIMTSKTLDQLVGCHVLFKCEHLQKTGSFKPRGALNNCIQLRDKGITSTVTHSSGNHGQAAAWAASINGIKCIVVVPDGAPQTKLDAITAYGATIVNSGKEARDVVCERIHKEQGIPDIQPFNSKETVAGQGTLALELLEQWTTEGEGVPDAIFVAVGGGGLAAGLSVVFPFTKIYLVAPEEKELDNQLDKGYEGDHSPLKTIADGVRVRAVGDVPLAILRSHQNKRVVSVNEDEIRDALRLLWVRLKQRVEPTAAMTFAGLRKVMANGNPDNLKNVCVILCGGNVDVDFVP